MQRYQNNFSKAQGNSLRPVAGASVLVTTIGGAVATIYSDNGVTTTTNPLTTDANGMFAFYAADGRYSLTITSSETATVVVSDILLEDPQDGSPMVINGGTISNSALSNITIDGVAVAGADIAKYSRLDDADGSALSGHIATGTGAQATTAQAKLRRAFINSADYDTLANALGASATNAVVDDATGNLFYRGKSVWGGGVTSAPADPIRHQWFAKNSLGQWFEALAVDDNGLADGNVVVVIPKFLSMGRTGTAGFIEFGPDLGAEAIITGSGSPNFHLLQRVSKQANSGHKIGFHTTGGHWEVARSSDNFASNSQTLFKFNASNTHQLFKYAGANPTMRWIGTDGSTNESEIFHDGNFRFKSPVGAIILENATQVYIGPNASTNPAFKVDNSVASAATGLQIVSRASGGGVDLSALSSGSNEDLRIAAKGTGNVLVSVGSFAVNTAGQGMRVKEGSNAKQGVATLVAGAVTVSNTSVTANSRIFLTSQADGGTPGFLRVSARSAGVSFTITSSSGTDTSTVAYQIFEPA